MAVSDAYVFPGFLTPVLTQLFFSKPPTTFLTCFCRVSKPNLKALADDKINVAQMMISVYDWVENIVEKGENAGYQHFFLFPQYFQKAPFLGSLKCRDCVERSQSIFSFSYPLPHNTAF